MKPSENFEREVWFRFFLELTPDATIVVDDQGIIQMANSQAEILFGYTKDEMIGNAVEILVPEQFRAGHWALRDKFIASSSVRLMQSSIDLMAQTKSGELVPVSIGLSPMHSSEERSGPEPMAAVMVRPVCSCSP